MALGRKLSSFDEAGNILDTHKFPLFITDFDNYWVETAVLLAWILNKVAINQGLVYSKKYVIETMTNMYISSDLVDAEILYITVDKQPYEWPEEVDLNSTTGELNFGLTTLYPGSVIRIMYKKFSNS